MCAKMLLRCVSAAVQSKHAFEDLKINVQLWKNV